MINKNFEYQLEIASENAKKAKNAELQSTAEKSEQKNNTTEDSGVKCSIKQTKKMDYAQQIELVENEKLNGSNAIYVGEAPDLLVQVGFNDYPFAMNQSDYRKSRRTATKNKNYSKHGVKRKFFEQLPQKINDAVMFIDNGEKVTVITDSLMLDSKGQPSYIIAGIMKNQKMDDDFVNQIKSVYPLDDFANIIQKNAENGKLVIINKNKANDLLAPIGIQPSQRSRIINLARDSLSQVADDVNENQQKNNTTEDGGVKYSKKYLEAKSNQDIVDLVFKVENEDFKPNEKVFFESVSEDVAEKIESLTGVQVKGFKVAIEARQIEHILNEHGINGKSDNSMSDVNDISKMEYVLKYPDEIREAGRTQAYSYMENGYNRTAKTVLYEKVLGDNSYYVVQAVPDTKKKTLYIVSAFIGKSGYKKEAPQLIDAKSPNATSKDGSVFASTNIISDKVEKINTKSEKTDGENEKIVKSIKLSPDAKRVLEENPELKQVFEYLQKQFKLARKTVPSEEQLMSYAEEFKKNIPTTIDVYELKREFRNIYSILASMTVSRGLEYATSATFKLAEKILENSEVLDKVNRDKKLLREQLTKALKGRILKDCNLQFHRLQSLTFFF